MITSVIVDDQRTNVQYLHDLIGIHTPYIKVQDAAHDVQSAVNLIERVQPDLVFLDIEMPGGTGFDLLEQFDKVNFEVIFTTSHEHYALKAFRFAALDYLLKPIRPDELIQATAKIKEALSSGEQPDHNQRISILQEARQQSYDKIALPTNDGYEFHKIENIIRCEANRAYCTFYMRDGSKVLVSKSMKEFEDILLSCNFFRTHKSHMINLSHMKKYVKGKGGYVVMEDDAEVAVAVRKKEELLQVIDAQIA